MLGLQFVFPILSWGREYTRAKFKGDLIAGLTIASLCIPQDVGYSMLANLDPQYGLYSSFVLPLIYVMMGSSRDIAIGPVAVVSLLLGSLLREELDPIANKAEYEKLAITATFFAGVTQAALGFLRLGFLIEFLLYGAIIGFMAGAAITIALQQLKVELANNNDCGFFPCIPSDGKIHWKEKKKYFWVLAIAPLISVVAATLIVYLTRADKDDVQIEAIAIGRTFATMKDYQVDGNKEMVALGTMNIVGSMTSSYIATESDAMQPLMYLVTSVMNYESSK